MNWNNRLRPTNWREIVGNHELVTAIQSWEESGHYPPALLFTGSNGTGKTSAAHAIGNAALDGKTHSLNLLVTNASDDRGIDYIRHQLKQFAKLSSVDAKRKVVILDEACGLTPASQDALRGIMEQYVDRVLFILTANYPDKIRPAIKSRCRHFIFTRVSPEDGETHLKRLTESCGAPIEWEPYYSEVVSKHNGDLRAAVNWLETLPQTPEAIENIPSNLNGDTLMEDICNDDWLSLRDTLNDMLDSYAGKAGMMYNFHRIMSKYFDEDADTVFDVISIWGDMMDRVYDWPGSDISYVDVFIGRLKNRLGMEE